MDGRGVFSIADETAGLDGDGQLPADLIKLVGGVRYDIYHIVVDNRTVPGFSGTDDTSVVSPKGGIVISPLPTLDFFANKGTGFRPPSVQELSPSDPTQQANFNLAPSKIKSWDVGMNQRLWDRLKISFDYYQSELDNEILVIGNQPLNIDNTERDGYELEANYDLTRSLMVFGGYSWVQAKDLNPDLVGGDQVPGRSQKHHNSRYEMVEIPVGHPMDYCRCLHGDFWAGTSYV